MAESFQGLLLRHRGRTRLTQRQLATRAGVSRRSVQDWEAGLNYRWSVEGKRPHNILQSIGNGCAFLDFDNDGNLDILLVGSRTALFRGDGHGYGVRGLLDP